MVGKEAWRKALDRRSNALSYKTVFNRSYHDKDGAARTMSCTAYFVFFLNPLPSDPH